MTSKVKSQFAKKLLLKPLCILLSLLFFSQSTAFAENENPVASVGQAGQESEIYMAAQKNHYSSYLSSHPQLFPTSEIVIQASEEEKKHSWPVQVDEAGFYNIMLTYTCLSESVRMINYAVQINGDFPFDQANRLQLSRTWKDGYEIKQDSRGNDIRPRMEADYRTLTEFVKDKEGIYNEPFAFYFEEGENTLTLDFDDEELLLQEIKICNPSPLPTYKEYRQKNTGNEIRGSEQIIEAENTLVKSDTVLFPISDRSSVDTIPNDPVSLKLNTIGGMSWREAGQFITWTADVKESGYYKLGLRVRQNLARGLTSNRRLLVNGEVPFQEVNAISFSFSDKWQYMTLGNDEADYLFYLQEGKNEITLEVVPGEMGAVIEKLEAASYTLNQTYRKILMITGSDPDTYRDYQLELEIPGLINTLQTASDALSESRAELEATSKQGVSDSAAILNTLIVQLDGFIKKPATIPVRMTNYRENISSLADFNLSLKGQPLEIDYFSIYSSDQKSFGVKTGFLNQMKYHVLAFIGSFINDYTSVGDISEGQEDIEPIEVWINLGRDQVQVVKELSDNLFTPDSGIPVNIKLVQQGLVPAILSGRGPDVALFIGGGDVVNLAARNGLSRLDENRGFAKAVSNFSDQAIIPYQYNGGVYAMPITENFPMLFCRTDIFEELGVEIPKTWDEFYHVLSVIQKNNMTVGIPNVVSGNQMSTNNSIFAMLLYQRNGKYYNNNLSATTFSNTDAVDAFKQWTSFYSKYSLPTEYSFYMRFRTGELPMGIENYTMYNMLSIAAPEIRGMWQMYPLPGIPDKNSGEINNTAVASGTCAVVLRDAKNKENAWKFIEWFTDTEAQVQYGMQIEALLGASGRFDTANLAAFEKLPWTAEQASLIKEQWQNIVEIPQVPGGYYIDRNLTNAFRKVVYNYKNPRETLLYYTREIDTEIKRKRTEFGLDTNNSEGY